MTTIQGLARECKAGLDVNGVTLEGLSYDDVEKYDGKEVIVTGEIKDKTMPKDGPIVSGYEGQYMDEFEIKLK